MNGSDITLPLVGIVTLASILASVAAAWALTRRSAEQAESKASAVERDLADFKLEVAKNYASHNSLMAALKPLLDEMHQLRDRIDRMIDGRPTSRHRPGE